MPTSSVNAQGNTIMNTVAMSAFLVTRAI
jgi:hypothetical protein